MLTRSIAAGLAGSVLLAGAAFAQTPTTTSDQGKVVSESSVHGDWRTSKLDGLSVYNDKNEDIGTINDLLTDKSGNIKAAVISVGGFLGVGARLVAVPFDKLKFVDQPVVASNANTNGTRPPPSSTAPRTTTGSASSTSSSTTTSSSAKKNEWYPDHAVFNATKDELQKMPEFKYSSK